MIEIHLICNPTSGKGRALNVLNSIKEWAVSHQDLNLIIHETENIGHATSITRDLTSTGKPVKILVLGGDGSVNEVLNGIQNFENTTLGILPFGSGNDFARALNFVKPQPLELMEAYVYKPNVKKIDFMLLNDKYRSINEIGLGMSAEVLAYRDKMKRFKPETQYKIATFIKSFFWKLFSYQVSIDKQPDKEIKSMWFTINNGHAIGGGMITAADAKIDDGLISVMYVNKFNRIKTLPILLRAKKGKISTAKQASNFTCKELDLRGQDMTLEYDGILLEHLDHINVKIVPGKLNILIK